MIQMNKLLHTVVRNGASDLHLAVGKPPVVRLKGTLRTLDTAVLAAEDTAALMKSITPERCQQELQEVGSTDFSVGFEEENARFRVAIFRQRGNLSLALRLVPSRVMTFEELGLEPKLRELLFKPRGLVLVTGGTGSGKSTTLCTMIDFINIQRETHIITIEDPIEFYHEHKQSLITQREVGSDVPAFAEALRRALRQDPDVILVGEMRDLETIEAAITAAETGHLVFGTLHTNSAQGSVNRIINVFPVQQQDQIRVQLSQSLLSVISQQLIPKRSGDGVVAAFEILVMTSAISNLIRENKTYRIDSSIQTGRDRGMCLFDDSLIELFEEGIISRSEVVNRCRDNAAITQRLTEVEQAGGQTQ